MPSIWIDTATADWLDVVRKSTGDTRGEAARTLLAVARDVRGQRIAGRRRKRIAVTVRKIIRGTGAKRA